MAGRNSLLCHTSRARVVVFYFQLLEKLMGKIENSVMAEEVATTTFTLLPASGRDASADVADTSAVLEQSVEDMVRSGAIDSFVAVTLLETLEAERQSWEGKELAASHARLYAILTDCYGYYLGMKAADSPKQLRVQMAKGLERFIAMRKLRTLDKTHDMNRVVKAVFGEDRRRVSAYSRALRAGLTAC